MLRILKTRIDVLVVALVVTVSLFINNFILAEKRPIYIPQKVVIPSTPMTVLVVKKEPVKKVAKKNTELECLAAAIYHEARGESTEGQLAIGQVVLNRLNSKYFPDNICKVVFQPNQFTGLRSVKYNKETFANAKKVMQGAAKWLTDATHFHTLTVTPKWASSPQMEPRGQIGNHLFYRMG